MGALVLCECGCERVCLCRRVCVRKCVGVDVVVRVCVCGGLQHDHLQPNHIVTLGITLDIVGSLTLIKPSVRSLNIFCAV